MSYGYIALGGVAGALARWGWQGLWGSLAFPWATLSINLAGSFGLAFFLAKISAREGFPEHLRLGIAVGFFGSFTTFSSYTMEIVDLLAGGNWPEGFLYWWGSLLAGLAAAGAGWALGRLAPPKEGES